MNTTVTIYIVWPRWNFHKETASREMVGLEVRALEVRETEKSFVAEKYLNEFGYARILPKESPRARLLIGRTPAEAVEKFIAAKKYDIADAEREIRRHQADIEHFRQVLEWAGALREVSE